MTAQESARRSGPQLDSPLFQSTALRQPIDIPPVELATDRPRSAGLSARSADAPFTLPQRDSAVVLAAFLVLLGRYTGQTDVVVGAPVAQEGAAPRLVALRADLSGDPRLDDLVTQVRARLAEAAAAPATGEEPRLRVVFDHIGAAGRAAGGTWNDELRAQVIHGPADVSPPDITLLLAGDGDGGRGGDRYAVVRYRSELFDESTIVAGSVWVRRSWSGSLWSAAWTWWWRCSRSGRRAAPTCRWTPTTRPTGSPTWCPTAGRRSCSARPSSSPGSPTRSARWWRWTTR
jgi:hypothetical protein